MYLLKLMAHVEICCRMLLAMPWPRVPLLRCLSRGPFHLCFPHEPHIALRSCRSSCVLEMVHLSWQAVCEDHCHRVVVDQPFDGPVVITGPYMCGATLMTIGRRHSLRSMVVTSLCAP